MQNKITNLGKGLTEKAKVASIVEDYQRLFPEEYKNFLTAQRVKVNNITDKFATLKGSDVIERQLGEMPETLYYMLQTGLTGEETKWFNSKDGYTWFYNTYKEFKVTGGRV